MEPVTALGVLSLVLNIMCAALNLIRGIHLAEHSLQVTFSLQFKWKDTTMIEETDGNIFCL